MTAAPRVDTPSTLDRTPAGPGHALEPARNPVPVAAAWLELRESADAAARSAAMAELLGRALGRSTHHHRDPLTVHDLGAGTGSMMRWLAPRLVGEQHWLLHDTDTSLLERATGHHDGNPIRALGGAPIHATAVPGNISRLGPDAFSGADLITASALLDLLTAPEIRHLVALCAAAGCPVLFTLTVTGRVDLTPPDGLDDDLRVAFNDHQRRLCGADRLLGPDAVDAVTAEFRRRGATVLRGPSPWQLGASDADLAVDWLEGWVAPAVEMRDDLAAPAADYLHRRREQASARTLTVTVHHTDLLILTRDPR